MDIPLLPNRFRRIGWILFVPSLIWIVLLYFFDLKPGFLEINTFAIATKDFLGQTEFFVFLEKNISLDLALVMLIGGGLMVSFSKERAEDEYLGSIRLSALVWAVCINYLLLILAIIFLHGLMFLDAMAFNMVTILIIFISRYEWLKLKARREASYEE